MQTPSDAVTIASHKFHGPIGIGALLLRNDAKITPLLVGGSQQLGFRAGTEPVALIAGMSRALHLAISELNDAHREMLARREALESALSDKIPTIKIHSSHSDRLPQTTCFSIPGIDRQALLLRLDLEGFACSTGSACASGSSEPSHVLTAMGCSADDINSAIRISASKHNTMDEVLSLANAISTAYEALHR